MNRRCCIGVTVAVAMLLPVQAGMAAERGAVPPNMLKLILSCREITGGAERLACFDKQTDALSGRIAAGTVVVVDKVAARNAERAQFGLPPSGRAAFATIAGGEELNELVGTIKQARIDGYGKWVVTLADNTRWHQIDDYALSQTPRAGTKAVIRHGALGSFKMTIGGNAAVRVRREA